MLKFFGKIIFELSIISLTSPDKDLCCTTEHRNVSRSYFLPFFNQIVIKVGKPVKPPKSSSKDDLNLVTNFLKEKINKMII